MKTEKKTVNECIRTFSADIRKILEKIRQTIHKAVPEAVEAISYQMPTFNLNGKNSA